MQAEGDWFPLCAHLISSLHQAAPSLRMDPFVVSPDTKNLGLSEQTLHNWVKAAGNGGLKSSATPAVSAEQMEISRLRSELSRVKKHCYKRRSSRQTAPAHIDAHQSIILSCKTAPLSSRRRFSIMLTAMMAGRGGVVT
jgi:hypothetical protein